MADPPALLDVVALTEPVECWPAGTTGTIVDDLRDDVFLVELVGPDGATEDLLTLPAGALRVIEHPNRATPVAGD